MMKFAKHVLMALAAVAVSTAGTRASVVTVGSWSIEGSNTLNNATIINNDFGAASLSQLLSSPSGFVNNIREETAARPLFLAGLDDQTVDFGGSDANTTRGTVEMWLTGKQLVNQTGDDIWVTEAGGPGAPEAIMMRVYSGGAWSSWVYKYADVEWNPDADGTAAFFTGYDFVTDFGLSTSALVDKVQIQNGIDTDTTVSGEGVVTLGGGGGLLLDRGPLGGNSIYTSTQFDADLGYVFYGAAQDSVVPEPSTILLIGVGGALVYRQVRNRKRK